MTKTLPTDFQPVKSTWRRCAGSVINRKGFRPARASLLPSRMAKRAAMSGWKISRKCNGPSSRPKRSSKVRAKSCIHRLNSSAIPLCGDPNKTVPDNSQNRQPHRRLRVAKALDYGFWGACGFGIRNVHEPPKTIVRPSGRALARYSSSYLKKRVRPFTGRT
jgi:hypothetical protein